MDTQAIISIIGNLGFPIFVAVWMLYKSSKDSEEMRGAINELKDAITVLTEKINK